MDEVEEVYKPLHELLECSADISTEVQTSVLSYIYTCPKCGINRRYSVPKSNEFVGCDGNDLGLYKIE